MSVTFSPEPGSGQQLDIEDIEDIEVQMSNTNARWMCMVLDIDPFQLGGRESTDKFLARVLIALAQDREDGALPSFTDGRVTYCGRAPGYNTRKLLQLHEMALWAVERGIPNISWG